MKQLNKRINVKLTEQEHKDLSILSINEGKTVQFIVRELIKQRIDTNE